MKSQNPRFRMAATLAASTLAAYGLMFAVAAQATALSEMPLKPSVLAKPTVMFGMDDSGSMDSEVMLYTNDGAFWWNIPNTTTIGSGWSVDAAHPNTSLRSVTTLRFNDAGNANANWRKMVYLFPNGTGTGNRAYDDAANDHFAIMPTTQFAFLRWSGIRKNANGSFSGADPTPANSPFHNSLYYNPLVTYQPWAPGRIGTATRTFGAASTTAAKSHPLNGESGTNFSGGTGTLAMGTNTGVVKTDNWVFTAFPGMTVPADVEVRICSASNGACADWTTNATQTDVPAGQTWRVAMSYRPAVFWVRETCTPDANVQTGNCANLPDGSGTLKRYRIDASDGVTYNWGSFSRTGAEELQNFANWWQYYRKRKLMLNASMGETMENITGLRLGVVPFNSRPATVSLFDADATSAASNRLRVAGLFYNDNGAGGTPTRETLDHIGKQFASNTNAIQFACQRNAAFIVTDGFANTSATLATLASLGSTYYTTNPRTDLATGKVPATVRDPLTDLHVNTYGLTMGARGVFFLSETSTPPADADWIAPTANRNPSAVDDLWRATINSKGLMFLATTAEETAAKIQSGLDDIVSQTGSQSGVAVSAVNLDRSDGKAYLGFYNPRGWIGDLEARAINTGSAVIADTATWSAATLLNARTWSERVIFSASGTTGLDFTATNFGAALSPSGTADERAAIVNFLRGSRAGEGETVRRRRSVMGPVVNAEPVLDRDTGMVYLASGDGLLHGFNTSNGKEEWAFRPPGVATHNDWIELADSSTRGWAFKTLLDATPVVAKLTDSSKLLVGGMGAAGRRWYALDVSSPKNKDTAGAAAQFKWSFPSDADTTNQGRMGYSVGKAVVTRVSGITGNVVLVTSGYANAESIGDGRGRLWMLDTSGNVLKTFVTDEGSAGNAEAGLAHVAAARDADGNSRYAYAGDLLGNVWRFDLQTTGAGPHTPHRIARLRDGSNNVQPVTSVPQTVTIAGKRIVVVATGRILDVTDFGMTKQNSIYAISDGDTIADVRTTLVSRSYSQVNGTLTGDAVDWATKRGWYFDLPTGQHVDTDMAVAYGAVIAIANQNGATDCSQASTMYTVNITSGLANVAGASIADVLSTTNRSSRATVVVATDGKVHNLGTLGDGSNWKKTPNFGITINPAKNSWKEIRRDARR
jgi:type IV pilus assembly protein PilY1